MKPIETRKAASKYFTIIRSGLSDTHCMGMEFTKPIKGVYISNMLIDIAGKVEYIKSCSSLI